MGTVGYEYNVEYIPPVNEGSAQRSVPVDAEKNTNRQPAT
jgi:hypothetical protein